MPIDIMDLPQRSPHAAEHRPLDQSTINGQKWVDEFLQNKDAGTLEPVTGPRRFTTDIRAHQHEDSPPVTWPEIEKMLLRRDTHAPQIGKLHGDQTLSELPTVAKLVHQLTAVAKLPELHSPEGILNASVWVARNLKAEGLPITLESVQRELENIQHRRESCSSLSLLRGCSVVVAGNSETITEIRTRDGERLSKNSVQSGMEQMGIYRFMTPTLIESIRYAVGPTGSITHLRAERELAPLLLDLSQLYAQELSQLNVPVGNIGYLDDKTIAPIKAHFQEALGLSPHQEIFLRHFQDQNSTQSVLEISDRQTKPLITMGLTWKDGKITNILISPESCAEFQSPRDIDALTVKNNILMAISTTPPGPNGFRFIFDGHGSADKLYLEDGRQGVNNIYEPSREAFITAQEFASAVIERSKKFGSLSSDTYIIKACIAANFNTRVSELLRGTEAAPTFISENEYDQFGYTDLRYPVGSAFLTTFISVATSASSASLGNLMNHVDRADSNLQTNPVVLVPERGATVPLLTLGYRQID